MSSKHENYELLNLLGYGLAKFDKAFIAEFGFTTKQAFYNFFVQNGIVKTAGTVKNKMDLFDYFFPENPRKGWWQKGDAYVHRKILIDSLFGNENAVGFANVVKLMLKDKYAIDLFPKTNLFSETKYKKMQDTGLSAELYFQHNYHQIDCLHNGELQDARLYGDGYDFFVHTETTDFLCEIKGLKEENGSFRLTNHEYQKANQYKDSYLLVIVANLVEIPKFVYFHDPLSNLNFKQQIVKSKETFEWTSSI